MSQSSRAIVTNNLSLPQLNWIENLKKTLPVSGVLVGALPGRLVEQVQPLFLYNRQLFIARLVKVVNSELQVNLKSLEKHADLLGYNQLSSDNQLFCYLRPYYQNVLHDGEIFVNWDDQEVHEALASLFKNLISNIRNGVVHGHIWAGNIAVQEKSFMLVDYVASLLDSRTPVDITDCQLADIQSLARVVRDNIPSSLLKSFMPVLQACLQADGDIWQLCEKISSELQYASGVKVVGQVQQPIKAGRFIARTGRDENSSSVAEEGNITEFEQRTRKTSGLSADVVETIRKAVAEELAVHNNPIAPAIEVVQNLKVDEKLQVENTVQPTASHSVNGQPTLDSFKQHSSALDNLIVFVLIIGLAAIGYLAYERWFSDAGLLHKNNNYTNGSNTDNEAYWSSKIPSRMQIVAEKALSGDSDAELVIVQSALNGEKSPNVRADLLKIAFDQRWEHQLTDQDRKVALALGLSDLLREPVNDLPVLSDSHPGIILAAVANLPIQGEVGQIGELPVSILAGLPMELRAVFAELEALSIESFARPEARALVRIALGIINPESVQVFLGVEDNDQLFGRLRLLLRHFSEREDLITQVASIVKSNSTLEVFWNWFDKDQLGLWSGISNLDRLAILTGFTPKTPLILLHYADLLTFPAKHVVSSALLEINNLPVFAQQSTSLSFIAASYDQLERNQLVSLIAALAEMDPVRQETLIAGWFKTNPAPQFIAELVGLRAELTSPDLFSLEAARYLKDKDWQSSAILLRLFIKHRELLVRALAYTRLRVDQPEELSMLAQALKAEPDANLKEQLKLKLKEKKSR